MQKRILVIAGTTIIVITLWLSIALCQKRLTELRALNIVQASMAYVPHSEKIKPYLLGFDAPYADFLWIKTTLYFGNHYLTDGQYPWLLHMVDFVTRLNPNFYPAYEFAGLMIPDMCKNPEAARIILERGICSHVQRKWKLYYYLGMLSYRYFNDKEMAASYLARAVTQQNAPGYKLAGLAAAMFNKAGLQGQGKEFLEFAYAASENPEVKKYLMMKMKEQYHVQ
jgi:hypothetical protein